RADRSAELRAAAGVGNRRIAAGRGAPHLFGGKRGGGESQHLPKEVFASRSDMSAWGRGHLDASEPSHRIERVEAPSHHALGVAVDREKRWAIWSLGGNQQ